MQPTVFGRLGFRRSIPPARQADTLTSSVDALVQQQRQVQEELRALRETVAGLVRRESQLRAVLRRNAELDGEIPRLERIVANPDLEAHVQRAVAAAELKTHPFPFAIVDDLLPQDCYDALLEGIPPEELFSDQPFNKQELHVPLVLAPEFSSRIWRFFSDVVIERYVAAAVLEKFDAPLDEFIGRHWPGVSWRSLKRKVSNSRLMLRGRGYTIPPHRDPKWGFIICLLYLARPGDSERWGTQFYSVERDDEARSVTPHWIAPERCRLVEDVAYRANRLVVFLNSDGAHGATIPDDAPDELRRYAFQFRIGPNASAMDRLLAMLPEDKRELWARTGPAR